MSLALTDKTIDKYFGFLMRLDNDSKKKLIIKLTESIDTNEVNKIDFRDLYGSWEENRDAEEIIKEIRDSHIDSKNIADFL